MNHNIPISATFTLFKYLQVNPSVNYTERWYTRKVNQQYNEETRRLEALPGDTINGFYRVSNYSASLSLSTKLYVQTSFHEEKGNTDSSCVYATS